MTDPILLDERDVVAVCDGAKFILLRNDGSRSRPSLSVELERVQAHAPDRALGTDRPGRVQSIGTGPRSAVAGTDLHDAAETDFLRTVAIDLLKGVESGSYRQIVLVAPPRAIGQLRKELPRVVDEHVKAEVVADLVNLPVAEIQARFRPGAH